MTPNEYQKESIGTALLNYRRLSEKLTNSHQQILHAHLGLSSETGEIGDAIKKHFIYGRPLDYDNLKEECGDLLWYIALMLSACGYTMESCMEDNIQKLKIRYPEKFTERDAMERKDKI